MVERGEPIASWSPFPSRDLRLPPEDHGDSLDSMHARRADRFMSRWAASQRRLQRERHRPSWSEVRPSVCRLLAFQLQLVALGENSRTSWFSWRQDAARAVADAAAGFHQVSRFCQQGLLRRGELLHGLTPQPVAGLDPPGQNARVRARGVEQDCVEGLALSAVAVRDDRYARQPQPGVLSRSIARG
jgi:hypothetical protein